MCNLRNIRDQLFVETDKKYHNVIENYLSDIESRGLQEEFLKEYGEALEAQFHPYDSLLLICHTLKKH